MQVLTYTDYALRILIYLGAAPAAPVPASKVAAAYGISPDHVAKAAKALVRLGVVKGTRGAGGGLSLSRPAAQIAIGEVVRRFEAGRAPVACLRAGTPACRILPGCGLRKIFAQAAEAFYRELDRHSLADLLDDRPALAHLLSPAARHGHRPRA